MIDHLPEVAAEQAIARCLEGCANRAELPMEIRDQCYEALAEWRKLRPATAAGV